MHIIQLLLTYKYFILIPLAVLEGPIASVIAGFLASLGVFNLLFVYLIMVLGDNIGDAIYYYIGYSGKKLFRGYFARNEEKIKSAKEFFEKHHNKAIAASKIMWGIGPAGLVAAGALHIPYKRYFKICALYSLIQSFFMISLGIFFGQAYETIGKYFDYYTSTVSMIALALVLFFVFKKIYKKYKIKNI